MTAFDPDAVSPSGDSRRRRGLAIGVLGFFGTLLAPAIARLPEGILFWGGAALLAAALGTFFAGRARGSSAVSAIGALLVCLSLVLLVAPYAASMPQAARATLAATVLMAAWWVSLAIPIAATSLVPLVLFPALGVSTSGDTAAAYANNNIFLFLGGFILALGIQRWGLHRRIALQIVRVIGSNPSRMVLGFMVATAFLSMWISNTAAALMMLPIALAVIVSMREVAGGRRLGGFAPALLLGVAYSASLGGLATPIGTPPNISFLRILEILYPGAPSIPFGRWLLAFLPLVAVFLPLAWLLLTRVAHQPLRQSIAAGAEVIRDELRRLGPMGRAERRMLWIFTATAILWTTRGDLDIGHLRIPGWAGLVERWLGEPFAASNLHDATVAIAMAIVTFIVAGDPDKNGRRQALMNWETAKQLPWGILLLFGGGFALAGAFKTSGLSRFLGDTFAGQVLGLSPLALVVSSCLLLTFMTEVTSNTATTEVMLPVLAGTAGGLGVNPLLLMVPATLSASCAFMLPIATPPNAIVFGAGELEMRQMVRAGILLNLLGVVLISLYFYFVGSFLLGIHLGSVPAWAAS
ncbi:MAG: SLC13 family permease [Acidobacteriota bacterium]|nr:SLC13 family permease [Acidobacteriota bacterium]